MQGTPITCHWVRTDDGLSHLIPGCWGRVHDPDAPCTCGEWSEDTARRIIRTQGTTITRLQHEAQRLRGALRQHGIPDPTGHATMTAEQYRTSRRRRALHRIINGEDA